MLFGENSGGFLDFIRFVSSVSDCIFRFFRFVSSGSCLDGHLQGLADVGKLGHILADLIDRGIACNFAEAGAGRNY